MNEKFKLFLIKTVIMDFSVIVLYPSSISFWKQIQNNTLKSCHFTGMLEIYTTVFQSKQDHSIKLMNYLCISMWDNLPPNLN